MIDDTTINLPLQPTQAVLDAIGLLIPLPACEYRQRVAEQIYRTIIETTIQEDDE